MQAGAQLWGTRPEPVDSGSVDRLEQMLHDKFATLSGYTKPPEDVAKAIFAKFDTDKSSVIDIDEFMAALASLNFTSNPVEARALFSRCDADGSGNISYAELSSALFGPPAARRTLTIGKLREALAQRCGGAISLRGMSSQFDFMARRSSTVTKDQLERGLQTYLGKYGVYMKPSELDEVFKLFDKNADGKISFDEFIRSVRGEMNQRRRDLVLQAFKLLDTDGSGSATLDEIAAKYDTSKHPGVVAGKITRTEALTEFLKNWDKSGDQKVREGETERETERDRERKRDRVSE